MIWSAVASEARHRFGLPAQPRVMNRSMNDDSDFDEFCEDFGAPPLSASERSSPGTSKACVGFAASLTREGSSASSVVAAVA
jgi:hypothetical protein